MLDIYAYLRKDHQVIKDLLEQITDTHDADKRQRLFTIFRNATERHTQTEEATFHIALRATRDVDMMRQESQSVEEHAEIIQFLDLLDDADHMADRWFVLFGQLKQALSHHIRRVEQEIFPQAQQLISGREAYDLASKMELLKQRGTDNGLHRAHAADFGFIQRLFN